MSFSNPIYFFRFDNLEKLSITLPIKTFNKYTQFQSLLGFRFNFHKLLEKIMRANHSLLKLYFEKFLYFINCKPQYFLIFSINFYKCTKFESRFWGIVARKVRTRKIRMIRSMNDGEHYTLIEQDKNSKNSFTL